MVIYRNADGVSQSFEYMPSVSMAREQSSSSVRTFVCGYDSSLQLNFDRDAQRCVHLFAHMQQKCRAAELLRAT